jgi:glyoxylase-like metal-dependent hydrolase (beta-lactamase superfamily II)
MAGPRDCRLERASEHVWWFTPDDRTDRPSLAIVAGSDASVLLDVGASPAHTASFLEAAAPLGLAPLRLAVLTHWHWDHSFGGAALDVPIAAHRITADELAREAAYDWSDEALAERVRTGAELEFCGDMIRLELPDRSSLRIVEPQIVFDDEGLELRLGGVTCEVRRVGGDHAVDSCVTHVIEDGLIFLGDCLSQRLHAPVAHRTLAGTREIVATIAAYGASTTVQGHWDELLDACALGRELDLLTSAADRVERLGDAALATAAGEDDRETLEHLLAGLSDRERSPERA